MRPQLATFLNSLTKGVKKMSRMTSWEKDHKKIANKITKERLAKGKSLPELPQDMIEWVYESRPYVGSNKRDFRITPFWIPIYRDDSDFAMVMGGRQIYKSTYCTDIIAATATQNPASQVAYITFDDSNRSLFSKQKLRIETFLLNSKLSPFLRHPGNVGEISLKNNSTIYLITDNYQYRHLEGRSPVLTVLDESQYQELGHFNKVYQAMMATKGKIRILGIGGEAGGPYERLWRKTNQMEWVYDDPNWRDSLQFDENGIVIGDYLNKVLSGKWIAQNSDENVIGNGYHIPQTIIPTIPLTEDDAINKYKVPVTYSIEYQRKDALSESHFKAFVMGEFYNAPHRPITYETIARCTNPYRYLPMLSPQEIAQIKVTFGDEILVSMGVDFGSGKTSHTVIAILVWWKKSDRIQLAYLDKREPENQLWQAEYITKIFKDSKCDIGVGDLGYGAIQVKTIQEGGANHKTGDLFNGVGNDKFFGCRTMSDVTKEHQNFHKTIDEHGEEAGRIEINKTQAIEGFIENLNRCISHPAYPDAEKLRRPRLMIPSRFEYQTDYLVNDMLNITRKDLQYLEDHTYDPRQRTQKEFNHPPDSVMAIIYGTTGINHHIKKRWNWFRL
ncbi:MAG: hypothetical protein GWN01_08965 [Nitrosopumilaceae archaeon]|nr:hypothetical protein [Nitrosopumilaceae archaeon]NIU01039.1 hypothetical protein [Nitrosopumilaceae archaeon]NIU87473.1 hypothetical protein [Nitrosopumilaceae archaeon]NIV65522.1 hypothetical protein [Nitrosopumilaceae archaeon]NIX61641.1 hypothetical protein [Nitrosopumilaceae archaeon]